VEMEDLDRDGEHGFDYLTFTLVSSKAPRKGVGLRVADSYAGNHPKDPILYLASLTSTWNHSPKKPIIYHWGQGTSKGRNSPSVKSMSNNAPMTDATPLSSVYPSNVAKNVADSDDPSYGEDEQTLIGPSLSPHPEVPTRASKVAGEASTLLDVDSDSDIHEFPLAKKLKDATDCYWVVAHVTPPSWKQHLREISIEQLCDIHDRAYMRQDILGNVLNSRTRELISTLHKAKTSYDAIRARELNKDRAYAERERKLDGLHSEYSRIILEEKKWVGYEQTLTSLRAKIEGIESERERLKSSEIQLCYRPSSKEEYDRAGDALANASYPFLAKYVVNPYASLEQLLLKKPPMLRSTFFGSRSKPLSSKVK
ncbi:hypothetical protein Tco_0280510, partial [Tanacetum coccineum]